MEYQKLSLKLLQQIALKLTYLSDYNAVNYLVDRFDSLYHDAKGNLYIKCIEYHTRMVKYNKVNISVLRDYLTCAQNCEKV